MGQPTYACILSFGLLLLIASSIDAYRPVFDVTTPFEPSIELRHLQQAGQSLNCTPARTFNDAKKPFCFQPETISTEARQFLSKVQPALQSCYCYCLHAWLTAEPSPLQQPTCLTATDKAHGLVIGMRHVHCDVQQHPTVVD